MLRPAFANVYNPLNNTQYVDTLLGTAGISHPARDFWIAALTNGTRTRAQVLREIAESGEVYSKYFNQAFVVMQYFGYLRRDPDALYLNWIQVLETTGDFRGMVSGFMNSLEYRFRFGPLDPLTGSADALARKARQAKEKMNPASSIRTMWPAVIAGEGARAPSKRVEFTQPNDNFKLAQYPNRKR